MKPRATGWVEIANASICSDLFVPNEPTWGLMQEIGKRGRKSVEEANDQISKSWANNAWASEALEWPKTLRDNDGETDLERQSTIIHRLADRANSLASLIFKLWVRILLSSFWNSEKTTCLTVICVQNRPRNQIWQLPMSCYYPSCIMKTSYLIGGSSKPATLRPVVDVINVIKARKLWVTPPAAV